MSEKAFGFCVVCGAERREIEIAVPYCRAYECVNGHQMVYQNSGGNIKQQNIPDSSETVLEFSTIQLEER